MKTVHKLILKSYAGPMVLTFFIVLFVFIMQFMWRYIDELVGKGLGMDVILELMMYAAVTLIPMVLPLATLFAAVMTMGNMGENYELLALKSAGISLPKIMRPLIILVLFVAVGSFFVANNLVPIATKKISALLYDIRQQKQSIEFKDGLFFNGMDDISIRVDRQDPKTKLLNGVLIYDTSDPNGNMTTTLADSGYISLSDDKKYLLVTLYSGERYEQARGYKWFDNSELRQNIFDVYNMVMKVPGFDFERTDQSMFNGSQTKNVRELQYVHLPFRQKPGQRLDSPCRHAPGRTGRKDREPSRPVESIDLRRRAEQGAQFAQLLFVRRGDFQGGAEPVVPIQGRVAQENVAARIDHDFLPDRGSARSHYTQGGARHAGRRLGRLFRDLLHHHDHRRKDGAGRFVGLVSGHVDRNVHSASDLGIPDL